MIEINKSLNLYNLGAPKESHDAVTKAFVNKKVEALTTKLDKFRSGIDTEIKTIKSDLKKLNIIIKSDVQAEVNLIEKAINERLFSANKDFVNKVDRKFNQLEGFIFKYLKYKNGDAKKLNLKAQQLNFK